MEECKMSHSRDQETFLALGMQKVSFQGPEEFSDIGECEKDLWVAGRMSWYQQRHCNSLVMEFSDEKLKQKGFFSQCVKNNACKISVLVSLFWSM
jgi:hypothetical protein